ncbi:MAG: bifunctional helix-turn-helix transcriptional regulator/GNAT family N-acetyltransferase [Stappiaceae bacterium]
MENPISKSRLDRVRTSARTIVRDLGFMDSKLAGTQLPPSAVHTIIEVGYGTVSTAGELGSLLHLEKSSISRMLKKLEAEGFLEIVQDVSDKRAHVLELSPSGKALLEQIEKFGREQLSSALEKSSEGDLQIMEDGLAAFSNALRGNGPHVQPGKMDVIEGYQPCIVADVTGMHSSFYSKNYGFGSVFERKVATELSEFLGRIERPMNTVFSAYQGNSFLGSVAIDGESLGNDTAHLRWFIVDPVAHGLGIGKRLMRCATDFVDGFGFGETRLWTFRGLDAARHLYEIFGFHLVEENVGSQWGTAVTEQVYVRSGFR